MTSLKTELATVARLSLPASLTQLGMMMTGVVDTLMASRLGTEALAASALANMWQWSWLSLGLGLVMGIDPLISQAHGRGDGRGAALALQRGLVVAALASVPIGLAVALTKPGLILLGQDAKVAGMAASYNLLKLPTVPCFLIYSALRQYLQGRALMAPATWVMWITNVVHVVLNWALIFGRLGAPALGLEGAAISSSITVGFLALGLMLWIRWFRLYEGAWRPWDRASFARSGLAQVARLGLPIGAQISLEAWAFSSATLMAGWISTEAVGGHQLVLNMSSLSFMVPLGVSQGAATRVGNMIGAGDSPGMRRAAKAALLLGALVMSFSALLFGGLRNELPRLYTDDAQIVLLAAQILPIAAAFQLSDGTQAVAGGILRGMGRPAASALINLVGYYVVALPCAYCLGFVFKAGLVGIWIGLAVGLTVVASAMLVWVRRTARRPLSELRVAVDHGLSS